MRNPLSQLVAVGPELAAYILALPLLTGAPAYAQSTATAAPAPNLDLSQLGRVAVGGDFDSISLYAYEGQNETLSNNGSRALLTRFPDGTFETLGLVDADASITAMCPFISRDGTDNGVVIAGNFTSLGGVEAASVALFNPNTSEITALPGISGSVHAIYCDQNSSTVYVGGNFMAGNSTNAMIWVRGWVNLPFAGFNGPVNSITKDSAGNFIFAGEFDGLGNATTPTERDAQVVNLGGGNISAAGTTTDPANDDPRSIICGTSSDSNSTWLLADNTGGWWEGSYGFGFNPTKLRLYNAVQGGRGTKSFYFENLNNGGILNLTYVDPTTGQNQSCTNFCPLPENNSTAQDFHFVNSVGMNQFRIYITAWYGTSGGLSGIEMFQDDIYSYAVNDFNEPRCDGVSNASSSIATPSNYWVRIPNDNQTESDFLRATLNESSQVSASTNVVFQPNLEQSGNYSVFVYTPGCVMDNSCGSRGQVNLTASLTSDQAPVTTTLFQTNNYDKFDQIYYGYIDLASGSFRPSVTLAPVPGQSVLPLTVAASRVRFDLVSSTGGLNGLYSYNPNQAAVTTDFSTSSIDQAGSAMQGGAVFSSVVQYQDTTFAAGAFIGNGMSNIIAITDNATALPGGGLNGNVASLLLNGSTLYVSGAFDNTADQTATGLNGVAVYSIPDNRWSALGAGVGNGDVFDIVPLQLNITTNNLQDCLAVTGNFTTVNAFAGHDAFDSDGFAVWVLSQNDWLNNMPNSTVAIDGMLTAYTQIPGSDALYGGAITSQGFNYSSAVELVGSGQPTIESLGMRIQSSSSTVSKRSLQKRALATQSSGQNYTGVYDGLFYQDNGFNITILGGNFAATATNGSTVENLVFVNNTDSSRQTVSGVSGLNSDSIFVAMDTYETMLFAGGVVNGTVGSSRVQGLVVYDLARNTFASPVPPPLTGNNATVNAIATQPSSSFVYVGGNFANAGSLPCGTLCIYDASAMSWGAPGPGLSGTINAMVWTSNTQLVVAGNLTVGGNATTMATYDSKAMTFAEYTGASTLPGPISAISTINEDYNQWWASGVATSNNSVFLSRFENNVWTGVGGLGATTNIRKLQIMPLTSNHASSPLMAADQDLMILGSISIAGQSNASAVLFNGTTFEPYLLTNMEGGAQGSLSAIFVSNPQNFITSNQHQLALGFIVLIGLAIALALVALIVLAGILLERRRRRREGYIPIRAGRVDRTTNIARLPPETLFQNLEAKSSPPKL